VTGAARLPIRMLHDRVLVSADGEGGERRAASGIVIPATARWARLAWAGVVAVGQHVRQVQVGDRVLYDPEDRAEVELQGSRTSCCASATSTPSRRPASRTARPACTCDAAGPARRARASPGPGAARRRAAQRPLHPLAVDGPLPADMLRAVPAIRRDPLAFLEPPSPATATSSPSRCRARRCCSSTPRPAPGTCCSDNHRGYGKRTVQYGASRWSPARACSPRTATVAPPPPDRAARFHHGHLDAVADQAARRGPRWQQWAAPPAS
jgi:chaperonin GroES